MNPYFVPILAYLLMEGVGRRAQTHSADAESGPLTPAYLPVRTAEDAPRRRSREAPDNGFRVTRNFGRPGPLR